LNSKENRADAFVLSLEVGMLGQRRRRIGAALVLAVSGGIVRVAWQQLAAQDGPYSLRAMAVEGQRACRAGAGNATSREALGSGVVRSDHDLEEIVEGPGLVDIRETRAACLFLVDEDMGRTDHFPHALQQILRCFSYWIASSEDARLPKHDRYFVVPRRQPVSSEFVSGLIKQLRSTFGVRFVHFKHDLRVVRAKNLSYSFDATNSFAMRGPHDARALRDGVWKALGLPAADLSSCSGEATTNRTTVRIGILDRKKTRRLRNKGSVVRAIESEMQASLPSVQVRFLVGDFEDRTFPEQVEYMSSVDVLVSPHGAQLSGIPFLPNCGRVVELFPTGYLVPNFYGSLAAASGIAHSYLYLGRGGASSRGRRREILRAMKTLESRTAAREADLCPHPEALARSVVDAVREWLGCCQLGDLH
jgi:hypothetical protein